MRARRRARRRATPRRLPSPSQHALPPWRRAPRLQVSSQRHAIPWLGDQASPPGKFTYSVDFLLNILKKKVRNLGLFPSSRGPSFNKSKVWCGSAVGGLWVGRRVRGLRSWLGPRPFAHGARSRAACAARRVRPVGILEALPPRRNVSCHCRLGRDRGCLPCRASQPCAVPEAPLFTGPVCDEAGSDPRELPVPTRLVQLQGKQGGQARRAAHRSTQCPPGGCKHLAEAGNLPGSHPRSARPCARTFSGFLSRG